MSGLHLATFAVLTTFLSVPPGQAQELTVWLANGESELIQTRFTAGDTITATCNKNCLDLDLYLIRCPG